MTFNFEIAGESIADDFICERWDYENMESLTDALEMAENDAMELLEDFGGGHIDIFNEDGKFLSDVEV